jgi:tetratricopeptide (TPR) repeat protein
VPMEVKTHGAYPNPSAAKGDVRAARKGIFRKEGEYWTIGYGANRFRLKDSKGLAYLAYLLRNPGTEFHALDLVSGIAIRSQQDQINLSIPGLPHSGRHLDEAGMTIGSQGDAGEMLDEQAKTAYRRRLSGLREELEEAKELGKVERAEQVEKEIDALVRELSRAVGLGGRNRRAASASERARQSVSKTIKALLERIAQNDATLGDIFSRCIRTGMFCSYQPDLDFPIAWEFAETITESAEQPILSGDPVPARANLLQMPPVVLEVSAFSLADRTAFVGREAERVAIRAIIDCALSGHGSLVMLGGEPGVGKTRLAMEMGEYAKGVGFRSLVGHCYERDEPFPYLPFVEMIESGLAHAASLDYYRQVIGDNAAELAQIAPRLRRIFPDIPKPLELPPAQRRRYLFQSVAEALGRAARIHPQLLVLDDLHWADESTLELLNYLANRIAQLPVVMIGTYRDGDSKNNPTLVRTLEELIRLGIRPLKLGGLSKDAVAQMLGDLSHRRAPENLVNAVFEESQGNPFFVEEVYRHLLEEGKVFDPAGEFRTDLKIDEGDVPEIVRSIISRRLERFDENEKRVLAAAAVIGRSFSFQLLNRISQIDVDELFAAIEKAQQMGMIILSAEGPERPFTFGHELVRQTLLAGISVPRQQLLHARVADAIERLCPDAVNYRAGDIANHLLKAGSFADGRKLVHYLTLAGKSALEAAAFEEARHSFRSALSHLTDVDVRERAVLLANLATAERGLKQWDAAVANLRESFEIHMGIDDREMIAKSCTDLAAVFVWAGRFQEATETARRGLAYLDADVSADRARLLAVLGQAGAGAGEYDSAHGPLREALNIASHLSDAKLVAILRGVRSLVDYHFVRLREAAADGIFSDESGPSEIPPWDRAVQLQALYQTLLLLGRLEEATRVRDKLEPLASKIGQSWSIARSLVTRAWTEFGKAADLAQLETVLQQALKPDQKDPFAFWDVFSEAQLSMVDFFRGNWASALFHAQASSSPQVETFIQGFGVGTLFRHMAYAGDHGGALAILDEKRTWLPRIDQQNTMGSWWMLVLVIEGLVMLGEQSQAAQLYPLVRELIGTGAVALWPIFRFTHTVAGMAAAAAHQWETAEDHFQIALQQAESFPHRLEQAEIHRFHAMMLMDRAAPGDREKAQTLLTEARETYTCIGMPRHIEITRNLLH